ncbi:PIG-L family deacetylase [Ferruginibacter sp. SUN106]|uniref:PIG-L family deacetylase n=1 Tax=Ferruginibacter sp. SUN106 TaxID=2978348 RepID=UPI003D3696D5
MKNKMLCSLAAMANFGLRKKIVFFFLVLSFCEVKSQTPRSYTSSEILLQLKKLNVLGSVLYIAAHPDDENTRLLAYLANEKLYRTGYLSLTRGDGGQNLIGDEQGVDLGLIRTQELLAARRVDGAEQFFSRAFDFGFSKSPEEALRIWGHDKILSDVVWVIRKFKPDVIITRFPTTGEGGHGHHTASAILAGEAFDAAADPTKFPEQLKYVSIWQAKRLLWNTFNFGTTNTQRDDQFKLECGDYNPILGKSYGEIAATSRSMHKSQGFGVPAQRGSVIEYFKTIKGAAPVNDLMDGIDLSWSRVTKENIENTINDIFKNYDVQHPEKSDAALVKLYTDLDKINDPYWKTLKQAEIKKIIENCSGLFMEAVANTQYAVQGDSLKVTLTVNNRSGANILSADVQIDTTYLIFDQLKKNMNATRNYTWFIEPDTKLTQPYWLENQKDKGSFNVSEQQLIGKGENDPLSVNFSMMVEGKEFVFTKPVYYKYTDPVKGEIYQPVNIIPAFSVSSIPQLSINHGASNKWEIKSYRDDNRFKKYIINSEGKVLGTDIDTLLSKNQTVRIQTSVNWDPYILFDSLGNDLTKGVFIHEEIPYKFDKKPYLQLQNINYDHIPSIAYTRPTVFTAKMFDLKTVGNYAGYIPGAGDKIPEALEQMGYKVVTLKQSDMTAANLRQFDVIVTGVRTYNTNEWMNNVYDALMQYVKEGGVLFTQYNTSNQIGPVRAKIAPYPFTISRNRITDEEAKVNFLIPDHKALNYPNKITDKDFEGWIQERSIYNAENIDTAYRRILSMKDPGENEQDGSLIIANYGKGRFVYTGLVFFRELPAGVPGAYRLFANLIANKRVKYIK